MITPDEVGTHGLVRGFSTNRYVGDLVNRQDLVVRLVLLVLLAPIAIVLALTVGVLLIEPVASVVSPFL